MVAKQIGHRLRAKAAAVLAAPAVALPRAAARIQERFREDATTKRGNVPGFGDRGGPITATPGATGITVRAPDWVMSKAYDRAQPSDWAEILREELRAAVEAGD